VKRVASPLLVILSLAVGCASANGVTRMVGGHRIEGRFVADQAYAAYLKGVVLETEGEVDGALAAYGEAIAHDSDSAEIWTRIGVLRCADRRQPVGAVKTEGPWEAFARASKIDPEYEETWTESARCHLKRDEIDDAARATRLAVSLDPDSVEPAVLLAQVLERQARIDEARHWLDGLVARNPSSIDAHEAMIAFAGRTHDEARRLASEEMLATLRPRTGSETSRAQRRASDVDAALVLGDFQRARRLALASRVSSGGLALRAAALGRLSFARSQAELVLAADPADTDARAAAAVTADLTRDDAALARVMSGVPPGASGVSPLATVLMAELLARRVGSAAESAWMEAAGPVTAGGDELVESVARRVRERSRASLAGGRPPRP
jgi:tetratricopeptide (TPR) repeat protein